MFKNTKTKYYIKKYLGTFKLQIVNTFVLMVLISVLQFEIPRVTQTIIDEIIPNKAIHELWFQLLTLAILTLMIALISYITTITINKLSHNAIEHLRNDLYAHVLSLDFAYFENNKTGSTLELINNDVGIIQDLISPNTFAIFGNIVTFVGIFIFILLNDWVLLLLICITFPLLYFSKKIFSRHIKQAYRNVREASGKVVHHLQTTLTLIPLIKTSRTEDFEVNRFKSYTQDYNQFNEKAVSIQAAYGPTSDFIDMIGKAIVLAYGALGVMNGSMTVGIVVTYLSYLSLLQKPMKSFSSMISRFQQAQVSFERIDTMFEQRPTIDASNTSEGYPEMGALSFKNVWFDYGNSIDVLKNVSFTLKPNQTTALVGSSGSGKTTITKLLTRLYNATHGQITMNGTDIETIHLDEWLGHMGLVSQDNNLIDGTLYENITYGCSNFTQANLEDAVKKAKIDTFIMGLPDQYETEIGERGLKLSGGQKQRVAIARMFLKNAPFIILDEATASLDNETEKYIQESLNSLMENKTCLVIAHRLSTIVNADNILVLEDGMIVESGTHQTLLEKSNRYSQIYNAQFK